MDLLCSAPAAGCALVELAAAAAIIALTLLKPKKFLLDVMITFPLVAYGQYVMSGRQLGGLAHLLRALAAYRGRVYVQHRV